jgi:hypothetical protein
MSYGRDSIWWPLVLPEKQPICDRSTNFPLLDRLSSECHGREHVGIYFDIREPLNNLVISRKTLDLMASDFSIEHPSALEE